MKLSRMTKKPASTLFFLMFLVATSFAQVDEQTESEQETVPKEEAIPSIAEKTDGMISHQGFVPFYWDETTGQLLIEISRWDEEFLYVHSLATGLGSNPVGLDRGQLGDEKVVHFTKAGPRVLMVERNLRFRAVTENELERQAVEQSFAQSVIWGGTVAAESDGKVLVDITSLLMSDIHGVIQTLSNSDQGDYSLDEERSAVYLPRCKAFPENTELESTLTFAVKTLAGNNPGRYVQQTTPTPNSISLRQHHSFIKLPDDNYRPRKYDVRSPCIHITFADYASPLDVQLQKRWIVRHRLQKKNPDQELSEPIEPIIYYVDAGAPKQIQEALVEGASWWNEAFESAGFKDAFQVKLLPPDADPLDVRYNVIQWVHRSTRGWSYGGAVTDPRTGEIIKGHVTLGSLRVRQDQLLVKGLEDSALSSGNRNCACCGIIGIAEEASLADLDSKTDALEVALARIRQLSAHEVGHTLGFVHNFAASTYADRASVMDYPAPRVRITETGELDLSDAYGVGIGEWDKLSVQFAYSEYADAETESAELNSLLTQAKNEGMIFISDADARPADAAQPHGNLWDNGSDPLDELRHVMKVRRIALDQFDPSSLPPETTSADIAQYFTPIYLHHRYQLNAVGKLIGGYWYEYGYAGEGVRKSIVPAEKQRAAIQALLETIRPGELLISKDVHEAISPRPFQTIRDQEILPTETGRIFDPIAAARVAADLTFDELLQPQRLARLSVQSREAPFLAPTALIPRISRNALEICVDGDSAEQMQIGMVVCEVMVEHLIKTVDDSSASLDVRAGALQALQNMLDQNLPVELGPAGIHINRQIRQVLERPFEAPPKKTPLRTPPGSPIGEGR